MLKEFAVRNNLVWEIIIIRLQVCSASYGVSFWQLCWCFFSAVNCAPFVLQLLFTVFSDSFGGSSDLCVQLSAFLFAGCKFGARCELCLVWSIEAKFTEIM
jgi:hypothetical protein